MDPNGISHTPVDGVASQFFLEVVHDIYDRVLEEAQTQKAGNIATIDDIINKYAACTDQHDSSLIHLR